MTRKVRPRVWVKPGDVFHRLTVLEFAEFVGDGSKTAWRCRCACGREKVVRAEYIARGWTKSCGCLRTERGVRQVAVMRRCPPCGRFFNPAGRPHVCGFAPRGARGRFRPDERTT